MRRTFASLSTREYYAYWVLTSLNTYCLLDTLPTSHLFQLLTQKTCSRLGFFIFLYVPPKSISLSRGLYFKKKYSESGHFSPPVMHCYGSKHHPLSLRLVWLSPNFSACFSSFSLPSFLYRENRENLIKGQVRKLLCSKPSDGPHLPRSKSQSHHQSL